MIILRSWISTWVYKLNFLYQSTVCYLIHIPFKLFHRMLQHTKCCGGSRVPVLLQDPLTHELLMAEATFLVKVDPSQTAETIAKLFVEQIVCHHGIPEELLSDRGANSLMQEICKLLGMHMINTSGYHPQMDGLVEKFNSTLINMIAKCSEESPCEWDSKLPYVLFVYRTYAQESTLW